MAIAELKGKQVPIKLWAPLEEVESKALDQLKNVAALPWVVSHVAAMADTHYGIGCTVGSVIAMRGAVSPAAVGVDIGCGMGAVPTNLTAKDLPDSLAEIRTSIEAAIPVGFAGHDSGAALHFVEQGGYSPIGKALYELMGGWSLVDPRVHPLAGKMRSQLGTLGGGNHFIEVCLDETDRVWVMLHSGSRNIGKTLAELHIAAARKLAHNQDLPDRDLAVFLAKTPEMEAYRHDLFWAQRYAMLNRKIMMELLLRALRLHLPQLTAGEGIWCHHNYVSEEHHFDEDVLVTRKGAISARKGEMGIIPGSMGTRSYIVEGRGASESFCSASHGAGRRMSRGAAKRQFTVGDLEAQTSGIECRKDAGVLDEIPGAYKDIDKVMANQQDLVEIKHALRQVLCVKG